MSSSGHNKPSAAADASSAPSLEDPQPLAGTFPPGEGIVARSVASLGGMDAVSKALQGATERATNKCLIAGLKDKTCVYPDDAHASNASTSNASTSASTGTGGGKALAGGLAGLMLGRAPPELVYVQGCEGAVVVLSKKRKAVKLIVGTHGCIAYSHARTHMHACIA